jgi:hypothetical protein
MQEQEGIAMFSINFTGALLGAALLALPVAQAQTRAVRYEEASAGFYEARLTGATATTQRGSVHAGTPGNGSHPTTFVIALSALGEGGAVILTWPNGLQPGPGTYTVNDRPTRSGFAALVVTGSPEHPAGAFRAEQGTVIITESSRGVLAGRFELDARGFLTIDPGAEDRRVSVSGTFASATVHADQAAIR